MEFQEELKRETEQSMKNRLENLSYNLEVLLETVKLNTTMLSLDRDIVSILDEGYTGFTYNDFRKIMEIKEKLQISLNTHEILKSIYVVSVKQPFFYRTDIRYTYDYEKVKETEWMKKIKGVEQNQYMLLPKDELTDSNPEDMFSYVVPVKDNTENGQIIGYILANTGYQTIDRYFKNNQIGINGEIFLYGDGQTLYSSSDDEETVQSLIKQNNLTSGKYKEGQIRENGFLITYKWSEEMNWLYLTRIPFSEVIEPSLNIARWAVALVAISIPLVIAGAFVLSRTIFSPINVLVENMGKVGNGVYTRIVDRRKDEFREVFGHFNTMTDRIFSLMDDLRRQESLTKELEVKNLQAQLNPHFLYNTLDAIHWAARDKDIEAVCQMTFLLSNYFRKNLSSGKEIVSVGEVADMIKSYMEIQRFRFMEGFSYTLFVDPEIEDKMVPKQLFQPIVENALYHGIERGCKDGFCQIAWEKEGSKIHFGVKDNGKGMREETLKKLQKDLESDVPDGLKNFALRNIQMQLRLYCGEKISITSTWGKGTTVSFYLDIREEG